MERNVGFTQSARYTCLEDLQQATNFSAINGLNLDYCGEEKCEPEHQFGPYIREKYVIHIILSGKGKYMMNGMQYTLTEGMAFLIYPGDETIYCADKEEPWHYMWIGFHGYRADEFLRSMGFSEELPVVSLKSTERIERCMKRMLDARKLTVMNELLRMSQLLEVFSIMMEDNQTLCREDKQDYSSSVYVRYAMDYMGIHFREKIKVDDIAELIGINRSYLTNIFKKEIQMSPQEYLINLRMEHAAALLKNTSEPIHVVAAESGYEDSLCFSKAFKQKFHMSPKNYRNEKVSLVDITQKGGYTSSFHL